MAEDNTEYTPDNFDVVKFVLTSQTGATADIRHLVTRMSVTESIDMLNAVYVVEIVDAVNLLETFAITGNEKLDIHLVKYDQDGNEHITKKKLAVIKVSNYERVNVQGQGYRLTCITETALASSLVRVSRALKGLASNMITNLFDEISGDDKLNKVSSPSMVDLNIVVPNLSFNDTFKLILKNILTPDFGTYHFYETLWDEYHAQTFGDLLARDSVDTFHLSISEGNANFPKGTREHFLDNIRSVFEINSNINFDALSGFKSGAYMSKRYDVDISQKTTRETWLDSREASSSRVRQNYPLSSDFSLAGKGTDQFKDSAIFLNTVNFYSYGYEGTFSTSTISTFGEQEKFISELNRELIAHEVETTGRWDIYAGSTIVLDFPKSSDPKNDQGKDLLLSGKYLVANVVHNFNLAEGEYKTQLSLRSDSIDFDMMEKA